MKRSSVVWSFPLLVIGCAAPRQRPMEGRCLTVPALPASVAAPVERAPSPDERLYPGSDDARTSPRRRYRTAVLLFAPPRSHSTESLETVETLSLQPLVCAIDGVLVAGVGCGEIMPAKVTVRLTDTSSSHDTIEVMRSTAPFVTNGEDGPVTFPAPYGPSCCMYKCCVGTTIPYRPAATPGSALATSKTVFGVWPADADIDLQPRETTDDPTKHAWKLQRLGARKLLEIATSDIDHDGHAESIVYESWANDYGIDVLVQGMSAPVHAFSCGNI